MKEKLILIIEDINDYDNTINKLCDVLKSITLVYVSNPKKLYKFIVNMKEYFDIIYHGLYKRDGGTK